MDGARNESGLSALVFGLGHKIGGDPDVKLGVVVALFLDPKRDMAVGSLAIFLDYNVAGDVDWNKPIFPALLILSPDLFGSQT